MAEQSALDPRTKRTIHTQEVLRIFRNTHEEVPGEVLNQDISWYMKKLLNSGYERK